jgi:type III restriction enzyme
MDEPHSLRWGCLKKYFEGFNITIALWCYLSQKEDSLPLSNGAYVLDSISSLRKSLVKKIWLYPRYSPNRIITCRH